MKKLLLILSIMTTSLTSFGQIGITVGTDAYSTYYWRGTKLGGAAVQPSVDYLSPIGLGVNVWSSFHGDEGFGKSEIDYSLYYSYAFENFTLSAGYINYVVTAGAPFGDDVDTSDVAKSVSNVSELNVGVSFPTVLLSPSVKFYYNVGTSDGAALAKYKKYIEASGSYSIALNETYSLNTSLTLGLGDDYYGDASFGIVNILPKVSLPLTFSGVSVTPSIAYGYNPSAFPGADKGFFLAGVGVYYAF